MMLPWPEDGTVLGHVVRVFLEAGASPVVVVTGEEAQEVGKAVEGWDVRRVPNPAFREGGMLSSIQAGLRALSPEVQAARITPGDMPSIQPETVRSVIEAWRESDRTLIAPSHGKRRGHPILADRGEWEPLLSLAPAQTMREYLRARTESIHHVVVGDPGVRMLRKPWCGVLLHPSALFNILPASSSTWNCPRTTAGRWNRGHEYLCSGDKGQRRTHRPV